MRFTMQNWMRPEPVEVTLERLARCGYDGITLAGEPADYDPIEIRELLVRHGLRCSGVLGQMKGGRDLTHPDAAVRTACVDYVGECLELAYELGGELFTLIPCEAGKTLPLASPEEEWHWCVEALRRCQAHAERLGVRIGIEPMNRFRTYFVNRCDQALALAHEVGGHCGVCLDTFHMNIEETDWRSAVRHAGSELLEVHVADNNRMPPGRGSFDWPALIGELTAIGYDGYLSVEFVPTEDRIPRPEGGDRGAAGDRAGIERRLREHGTGTGTLAREIPADVYETYAREAIDFLRACIARQPGLEAPTAAPPGFVQS